MTDSKLINHFKGKYISIICRDITTSESDSEGRVITGNAVINGFIIEECGYFIYIGTDNDYSISASIRKESVGMIKDITLETIPDNIPNREDWI
jgi:hypothetical protein